jgi:acyl transferase domain-containing protein/NADPH:quinone reductase-like Zn-dependent oxidoreductase/acyl carrier protein
VAANGHFNASKDFDPRRALKMATDQLSPSPEKLAEALRESLKTTERLRKENQRLLSQENDPIAIVGMGCRFPGGVHSPKELWDLLQGDVDAITEFPSNRGWGSIEDLFHPDPEHPRTTYSCEGGFVQDADEFDAAFFSIGPREALAMDPQQRLLLEVAWEAIESAGIDPGVLKGSPIGVYTGISATGYGLSVNPPEELEGHLLTGTTTSVASGRIAYAFGFGGPTMSVDTACSSSLVVLHLACQALRQGECSLALAGGSTVYATPHLFIAFSRQRGLAPDGRCKAFAAGADGVGWGEGAALVALERLEDAEETGHPVLALVRGTATNQDGASNGLSAPSGLAQERVIREALRNARLSPADIDMVEAHGTGTPIGDPIEAQALLSTYGQERQNGPLRLGSIKSNIGHAVAAAGMGGLIKTVMALQEGWLPRTLHVGEPTPHVDWSTGEIKLLTEPEPWPDRERPRRAGVSSFGISGTNAHAILEEAPVPAESEPPSGDGTADEPVLLPFLISAKSEEGLKGQAQKLHAHLAQNPQVGQLDLAFSLATARAQMDRRAVVVGSTREDAMGALEMLGAGAPGGSVILGAPGAGKVAFQFTGQGAQRPGMGGDLYRRFPVFASALDAACAELDSQLGRSLKELMFAAGDTPEAELLDRTEFAQPALFALEVALFRLVESFGLVPDLLIGHSIGEVSAAHVAGVLSLADAATLVVARGRLMGALPSGGGMLAVEATEEEVDQVLREDGEGISIAGLNGPMATVVSGANDKIELFEEVWKTRGRKVARLRVSHAFHSELMEPMLEEFGSIVQALDFQPPQVPVISNVSGEIAGEEIAQPDYWVRHVRSPVRYADGVAALERAGVRRFVELGPDAVLSALARLSLSPEVQGEVLAAPAMRARGAEEEEFIRFLGALHANGVAVRWEAFFEDGKARRVALPTYAFQRQRYWIEYREGIGDVNLLGQRPTEHPLLNAAVRQADDRGWLFTGRLTLEDHPWLADHAVMGFVLLPGTAYIELALVAGRGVGAEVVEELTFETPLVVPEEGAVQLQVVVEEPSEEARRRLAIYSRPESQGDAEEAPWTRHASGVLCPAARAGERREGATSQEALPPEGAEPVETDHLYDRLAEAGYDYGPAFQGLHAAWVRDDALFGEVALDDRQAREAEGYLAHPALVDASLHVALQAALAAEQGKLIVPFSVRGVRLHRKGAASLRVRLTQPEENTLALEARDHTDSEVLSIEGLVARPIDMNALQNARGVVHDSLYKVSWQRMALPQPKGEYRCALLGEGSFPGVEQRYADVEALALAIEAGAPAPDCVLVDVAAMAASQDLVPSTHAKVRRSLEVLKEWLAEQRVAALRLVFVSRGAVQAREGEVPEAGSAAVLGLLRSAQSEQPGRLVLLDLEAAVESFEVDWQTLFASGEPQLAVREGAVYVPRLASVESGELLALPDQASWQLSSDGQGTLAGLNLVSNPQSEEPLQEGQVRIAMRAAGLNFRDVLLALNSYPGEAPFGWEGAGVLTEVGSGVEGFAVGDRVMGAISPAFGSMAIAHHKGLVPLPEGWSFAQGASIPIAFLTAFYGLGDLAELKSGERVLIHAGAGGVGMAAIQIARHLGAEVFATASPGKWKALEDLGVDEDHLASSRDLGFREKFLAATEGKGVDVVLNALAGDFVDASLDLLPGGGRFIEMGKADVRDGEAISSSHPGVSYRAFDIAEAGPVRLSELLREVTDLFAAGTLRLEPITTWDIRRAIPAFRYLRDGRNVGKVVLTIPQPLDPKGTVLITGGTGSLGAVVARHLAEKREVRQLLLVSRRGAEAEGVAELQAELSATDCDVRVVACDVADRAQLEKVIASIPKDRPLTGVIHAAGVLADGTIETLGSEELERVLRPKVDAAVHLHELTEHLDLPLFTLFSSGAATIGNPGQGNYAAANAFLDALAQRRQANGLIGQALGWGLWAQEKGSGMGGDLDEVALNRLRRVGIVPLSTEKGLQLFDAARRIDEPAVVPVHLDLTALRRFARAGVLPPLLRRLVRAPINRGRSRERSLARRLAAIPEAEWGELVLQTLRSEVAAVLGYDSPEMIDPQVEFKDLGFDSLAAVELYNRLCQTTALRLPTTMGFDYPTPEALAGFLCEQMGEASGREDGKPKADSDEKGKAAAKKAKPATAKKAKAKSNGKPKAGKPKKTKAKANGKPKSGAAKKAKAKAGKAKKAKPKAKANGKPKKAAAEKAKAKVDEAKKPKADTASSS